MGYCNRVTRTSPDSQKYSEEKKKRHMYARVWTVGHQANENPRE